MAWVYFFAIAIVVALTFMYLAVTKKAYSKKWEE